MEVLVYVDSHDTMQRSRCSLLTVSLVHVEKRKIGWTNDEQGETQRCRYKDKEEKRQGGIKLKRMRNREGVIKVRMLMYLPSWTARKRRFQGHCYIGQ